MLNGFSLPCQLEEFVFLNSRVAVASVVIFIFSQSIVYVEVHVSWSPPGLQVIELFKCSTQLSMTFILLKYVKMSTLVGI